MSATKKKKKVPTAASRHGKERTGLSGDPLYRVNTRIFLSQVTFIKKEVARSKGELSEGDVHRQLLQEAINNREGI